ncbi:DctP family TRAP transporter solute-binding subunit [Ammoniphilus sp. 3BR4]|uniref:DctP family TRAP transporter solute-binding subunit n=1 Tax=Ammoniphilus sp. 3BR4 TaxID=3158265 RepID=UPI0034670C02
MKKIMKKSMNVLLASSLVMGLAACGGTTEQPAQSSQPSQPAAEGSGISERTIKIGSGATENSPVGQAMLEFKQIVEEKSGGKIKVQTFPGSQLGDDKQMIDALKAGTLEMSTPTTAPVVGTVKDFGIFDLPFTISSPEVADKVLASPVGQKLLDKLPEQGLIGLTYWEYGFRNLTNNVQPVAKVEDFKGLKIRTQQNNIHIDVFNALGANATPMAYSEVFSGLESGAIDGQENPVGAIEDNKYNEVQKYLSLTNHIYSPIALLMSKKFWDQLSDEEKKIIQEAAIQAGENEKKKVREQAQQSVTNLQNAGMEVNEFSAEEIAKAKEIIQPVIDKHSKELDQEIVKEFFNAIEAAK